MSISRSLAWMGASQIGAFAVQFVSQVVLLRYLSLHDAGIYAIAFSTVAILALAQTLGLQAFIIRERVLTPTIKATAFTVNVLLSVGLSLAVTILGLFGGSFLGDSGVREVLLALAITPLISIFSFLPLAILEREGRFREIALIGVATSIVSGGLTMALAVNGFGYMSAAYSQSGAAAITAILAMRIERHHAIPRLGFASWRKVIDFGMQMLAINGISALGLRLSDVALGRILGLSALGVYSRASGLNGMIWANLHLLIGRVLLVDFAEVHRKGGSLRDRYIRTVDLTTVLLWPMFAGFATIAGPFIYNVYGERWVAAAAPLALLAAASMILVAITMTWEVFTATGELRTQTRIEFVRSAFAFAAFIIGCYVSLRAAAAARVADAVFAVFMYRPHLNRMTNTTQGDFNRIYARNLLLTGVAVAPAILMMSWHDWSPGVSLALLSASVASGGLLWAIALLLLRHSLAVEVWNWVGNNRYAGSEND